MVDSLLSIFPTPDDLLALEPEELGGVLLEIAPSVMQNEMFTVADFAAQLFHSVGPWLSPGIAAPGEARDG